MSSISSRDKALAVENNVLKAAFNSATEQTVSIIDIISEGPIYGLVEGAASVFLNDDRVIGMSQTALPSATPYTLAITSGSSIATLNRALPISNALEGIRYFTVEGVFSASSITISNSGNFNTSTLLNITSPVGFFEDYMVGNNYSAGVTKARLVAEGYPTITGSITVKNSATSAVFNTSVAGAVRDIPYTIYIDFPLPVSSFSGTSVQLPEVAWFSGTYNIRVEGAQQAAVYTDISDATKYKQVTTQFRVGNLHQPILSQYNGQGNTSISNSNFSVSILEQSTLFGGVGATLELVGTSGVGFALSGAQVSQVDEIRFNIMYPSGLYSTSRNTGSTYPSYAFYQYGLQIKRAGVWSSTISLESDRRHTGSAENKNAFTVEETINLEPFAPFDDFKIIIDRRSRHDGYSVTSTGGDGGSRYTHVAGAALVSVVSVIKEALSYPYTAYAGVTFSSKEFQSVPSRTYHCRGRLVQVPSNYVTREESVNGVASYNRNTTTGVVESTYQDWDGAFRTTEVYTNNPAWIFHDLIVNNRYGLGAWVGAADVDKYSLYRIARYCDELVPNGGGGFEPRFTANLYLTKAVDAYKVLKDISTIFRGILYWMDSKLTPIMDEPKSPVYTFTLGNVIEGKFNYESTGSKTRVNQVVVSWNNPEADYKLEALLVEDKDNIIETGRIIGQEAVAMGSTSEGQALRFGRWKLWTAKNQKEIISFQTAINATFLGPGDIVNVQDANRYNVQYSGRISSNGVLSTIQIPLDRQITLNAGSSYEFSVIITEPGVFLTQDSAVINSISYNKGDLITGEFTENEAANLLDDSGNAILTSWKEYSRVETRDVSNGPGNPVSLDLVSALSHIPDRGAVWALKEVLSTGVISASSLKQYKILSIAEEGKQIHSIVAIEHYNEKFDAVDKDFVGAITETVYQPPKATDSVPSPRNLMVVKDGESSVRARRVTIKWDAPAPVGIGADYAYVSGYEIEHPFFYPNPISLGADTLTHTFDDIFVGTYSIGVRTINSRGNKSDLKRVRFTVGDAPDVEVTRGKGIAIGGTTNVPSFVTSDGYYKFEVPGYTISPIASPFTKFTNLSADEATYVQNCTNIPAVNYASITDPFLAELAAHYVVFDYSDIANPLKLIKYEFSDAINIPYWFDTGSGADTSASTFISGVGTVSVSGVQVEGVGTLFSTDYVQGDIIKFSATKAAIVVYVDTDNKLTIDREIEGVSSSTHSRQGLRLDPTYDCAVAQIKRDTTSGYSATTYLAIDPSLAAITKVATIQASPPFLTFGTEGAVSTPYTNLVLTISAPGFTSPEFKVTGAGFSNPEISQSAETVFSPGVAKVYTKTLDKVTTYVEGSLDFKVTVREASDPTNINKQATSSISILMTQFTGQKIFYQELAPVTGMVEGDFWVRDSDNRFHRYNGTSWIEIADDEFAALAADIAIAQATADGKIVSFYQTSPPAAIDSSSGDLWFDTDDGNTVYRYNGSSWLLAKDDQIATAINNASNAQATADGKVTTFVGPSAPVAEGVGDIWLDTDDYNRLYRWNGSSWLEFSIALEAVADVNQLNAVNAAFLGLTTSGDYKKTILSSTLAAAGSDPGTGIIIDKNGIRAYSSGTQTFNLTTAGGNGKFSGEVEAAYIYATGSRLASTGSGLDYSIIASVADWYSNGIYSSTVYGIAGRFLTSGAGTGLIVSNDGGGGGAKTALNVTSGHVIFAENLRVNGNSTIIGSNSVTGDITASSNIKLTSSTANLSLGNATLTGNANFCIKQGTAGSKTSGQFQIYGAGSSSGKTTLGLVLHEDVVGGTGAFTGINQMKIVINAVEYWLPIQIV